MSLNGWHFWKCRQVEENDKVEVKALGPAWGQEGHRELLRLGTGSCHCSAWGGGVRNRSLGVLQGEPYLLCPWPCDLAAPIESQKPASDGPGHVGNERGQGNVSHTHFCPSCHSNRFVSNYRLAQALTDPGVFLKPCFSVERQAGISGFHSLNYLSYWA